MRITFCQSLLTGAIVLNLFILYYVSQIQQQIMEKQHVHGRSFRKADNRTVSQTEMMQISQVTVILREFEEFENYVNIVAHSFLHQMPGLQFLVVSETQPYPPLILPKNARLLILSPNPEQPPQAHQPEFNVQSEFVLLVPDGVKLKHKQNLNKLVQQLQAQKGNMVRIVAVPVLSHAAVKCLDLQVNLKKWTATYYYAESGTGTSLCTALDGDAVILIRTEDLFSLSFPLARPLLSALFIQTALRGWKVKLLDSPLFAASHRPLFTSAHNQWKAEMYLKDAMGQLMQSFGVKHLILPDGQDQWFGCSKKTSRCFGTVFDDTPQYLYLNRWTPPCCLRALREIAKYVINILESSGVRYWLEGGSLLGAVRHQDIIPWDYDVDFGIYMEDVPICENLKNLDSGSLVDVNGYVWERAAEGNFYRVQYSETNHLHVDLWPFYPKNGVMTKDAWTGHKQDVEFPEHFLQPLVKMPFAGILANGPNNPRSFLELKFGEGVVENPQYPNPIKKKLGKGLL